jgi:hypothetical protein
MKVAGVGTPIYQILRVKEPPELDEEAVSASLQTRFRPAIDNGVPVSKVSLLQIAVRTGNNGSLPRSVIETFNR